MHKLYLDPFMDMCNGEILSYGIDQRPSAKNVMDALDKAIETTADCPYRRTFLFRRRTGIGNSDKAAV